eukprot:gene4555-9036_t
MLRAIDSVKTCGLLNSILDGNIKNIVVLTGAGVSCASGIPDFRSPGGMYETLRPELLTATSSQKRKLKMDPTQVVSFDMFSQNQFPYLEVRRPFILGTAEKKWLPTLTHFFCKVLFDKGILRRLYSQNIDGLDRQTNIPPELVINVHGTIATASCEFCKTPVSNEEFCHSMRTNIRNIYDDNDETAPTQSKNIVCKHCHSPGVKPDTVLYGRNLPPQFFSGVTADFPDNTDLLIITGTSLTVHPACDIVTKILPSTPRLVVDMNPVGLHLGLDFQSPSSRDILLPGPSDAIFLELTQALGWTQDLLVYKHLMATDSREILERSLI